MNVYKSSLTSTVLIWALNVNAADRIGTESEYTNLTSDRCIKQIDDKTTGAYTLNCSGTKGFRLLVHVDDERSSISVVGPDRKVFPLNFWDVVTSGFSSLGPKAEWRLAKKDGKSAPIGLIVRVNSVDQTDLDHPKQVSYLAIAKVSKEMACVTSVIKADSKESNIRARSDADNQSLHCKQGTSEIR